MTDKQQRNMVGLLAVLFLLVALFFIFGCSPEKRASKAIKRIGADPVAVALTKLRPDLLRGDTVEIDTTIKVPFEVRVPEYLHDTTYTDTGSVCKRFYYNDSKISFKIFELDGASNVWYKIKAVVVKDTVSKVITITEPCPPCPGRSLLDQITNEHKAEMMKKESQIQKLKNYRVWFWVIVVILVAMFIIRNLPIKPF